MLTTVYTSTATHDFTDQDLVDLLVTCRRNNQQTGLTGLLLHREGRFMQVLEGPDDAVRNVFAAIEDDTRHTDVRELLNEPISVRRFPQWSMGFRTVDDDTRHKLEGYDDFLDQPVAAAARPTTPSRARWLLEWFRTHPV